MAKVEVRDIYRLMREFLAGEQFAITSSSLELLTTAVANRLEAHPDDIDQLIGDVRNARVSALRDRSIDADIIETKSGRMRLLHEWDASKLTGACDNFPPI